MSDRRRTDDQELAAAAPITPTRVKSPTDVAGLEPTLPPSSPSSPAPISGIDDTIAPVPSGTSTGSTIPSTPGAVAGAKPDYPELTPVDAKHYVIGKEIAKGGMGRIRAARDRRLGRSVAIKELLAATGDFRGRFEREALITARLQHPAIVSVHEAGTWPSGEPFFAMKLVKGRPFEKVIADTNTTADRLALLPSLIAAVDALAYAHAEGVIHRDLKPGNILVGDFGETVVIDWGLAKDLKDRESAADPSVAPFLRSHGSLGGAETIVGSVMGTPAYMPPEQARGESVDERADVYALGAILYHALSGRMPYHGVTPEDVLTRVIAGPPPPLDRVAEDVPPDLVTIVSKAMSPAKDDRYRTASALADDLKRFQTGQLVGAHDYSRWQLVRRWAKRNRAAVGVAGVLLTVLTIGGVVSVRRILDERNTATRERGLAETAQGEAERHRQAAEDQRAQARAAEAVAKARANDLTLLQAHATIEHDPTRALAFLKTLDPSFTAWRTAGLLAMSARAAGIASVVNHFDNVISEVAFSPDDTLLAVAAVDANLYLIDTVHGTKRALTGATGELYHLAFFPDGKRVAAAGSASTIWIWDLASGAVVARLDTRVADVAGLAISPDGARLATTSGDGSTRVWDVAAGTSATLPGKLVGIYQVLFSPDGRWLAAAGDDAVDLWDLRATDAPRHVDRKGPVKGLVFSPDGRWLASTAGSDFSAHLLPVGGGAERELVGTGEVLYSLGLSAVAFSADGRWLVAGADDATVRIWDTRTGATRTLAVGSGQVKDVAFARTGGQFVSCASNTQCVLWDVASGRSLATFYGHVSAINSLAVSHDGRRFASGGRDGFTRVWALPAPTDIVWLLDMNPVSARFSPDGTLVADADDDGVHLWDRTNGSSTTVWKGEAVYVAFSPDGRRLAWGTGNHEVHVRTLATGDEVTLTGHTGEVWDVEFSHDGARLASTGTDHTIRVWDLASGKSRVFEGHLDVVCRVSWSPDDTLLASASLDRRIRVWTVATGASRELVGSPSYVFSVKFSPDGTWLASSGDDSAVRIWTLADGKVRLLKGHAGSVFSVDISPDGTMLATGSSDQTVRLWDVASGVSEVFHGHTANVVDVAFASDGSRILSAGSDKSVRVWDARPVGDGDALRAWLDANTNATLDADHQLTAP